MVTWVMVYAARVKRHPEKSPVFELDRQREKADADVNAVEPWTARRALVLGIFISAMGVLVWGILQKQWFIEEIGALFLAMGLVMGIVAGLRSNEIATAFVAGAKDMVTVTLIIACGRALLIIAREAKVLDTILFHGSGLISLLPGIVAAQVMFLVQCVINFFIHSGTAQAALTMPIMAPLADLVGLTRQTMVFAYQLCELVNPILPTSAVTMGVLGMAKIPWEKWARWFLPLMLTLMAPGVPPPHPAGADALGAVLGSRAADRPGGRKGRAMSILAALSPRFDLRRGARSAGPLPGAAPGDLPEDHRTLAKSTSYAGMEAFLTTVDGKGPVAVSVEGKTAQGRSLFLVHASARGRAPPSGSSSTRSSTATRSRARTLSSTWSATSRATRRASRRTSTSGSCRW